MKKMRKVVIALLVMAMVLGTVPVAQKNAEAKVTKRTMYVGNQLRIYVFGASLKKVKFKSSNKKVASVSKKGIIKEKKPGKTTITVKMGKKSDKYKITVKKKATTKKPKVTKTPVINNNVVNNPSTYVSPTPTIDPAIINNQLAANILVTATPMASGKVLYAITNNNTVKVYKVALSLAFYNATGAVVGTNDNTQYHVDAGETRYAIISPKEGADFAKTATSIACTQYDKYTAVKEKAAITLTGAPKADPADGVVLTIVNGNANKVTGDGVVVYKDATGAIVDAKWVYVSLEAGQTVFEEVYGPYDADYRDIPYTTYEVYYYGLSSY